MTNTLRSPCIDVCALDARAGHCTGCGRSLAEIAEWGGSKADRQRQILAAFPKRMPQLAAGLPVILRSPCRRFRQMKPTSETKAATGEAAVPVVANRWRWLNRAHPGVQIAR